MNFDQMADAVLWEESQDGSGDYQPGSHADPETMWGITPVDDPGKPIKEITKQDAIEIIRHRYWARIRGDDLPWPVAYALLDCIFVGGDGVRWMQRIVGVTEDGKVGPLTVAAVNEYQNAEAIALYICFMRLNHYIGIVGMNSLKSRFLVGWANRINRVAKRIVEG